ncbi:MAG: cobalamin-binding protein [Deltaproteobacteria bacterium]|nr:cobalamin-binding protein [Deltaproteobacteria bacterium]
MRIVSLIASSTEIICALGFEKNLVGRSHECDYPPSVKKLPICTEVKFPTKASSAEIDKSVKRILSDGLSVYRVNPEILAKLKPDLIVTQIQCQVCAVSEKDVMDAVCSLVDSKPKIVSLNPNALADIWEDIRKVAKALNTPDAAEKLISTLQARMNAVSAKSKNISKRPRVAMIEWIDPLMASGNWTPELVEMAGGINLFGEAGKHSPWMTYEELTAKNPDVIVINPCGFDIPRTLEETHLLTSKPGWKNLKAVNENRVFVADGNQFFNRPGPRVVEALEMLAEMFHPKVFPAGHEGTGWIRLTR